MNQQPFLTLAVYWFTRAKDNKLVAHKEVWLQIMMVNPCFPESKLELNCLSLASRDNRTFPGILAQMCTPPLPLSCGAGVRNI